MLTRVLVSKGRARTKPRKPPAKPSLVAALRGEVLPRVVTLLTLKQTRILIAYTVKTVPTKGGLGQNGLGLADALDLYHALRQSGHRTWPEWMMANPRVAVRTFNAIVDIRFRLGAPTGRP